MHSASVWSTLFRVRKQHESDGDVLELSYYSEFIELANTLNFREAASNLCISPSALSKHIRMLEENYQAELFIRDRRQVTITPAGAILLEHARAICKAYDESVKAIVDAKNNRPIILAGLVEGMDEQRIMLDVMREISSQGIERRVRVHTTGKLDMNDQIASLKNGQHDCFVFYDLATCLDDPDIEVEHICSIPLDIVVSTGNALANRDSVSVADMSGGTFIHLAGPFFTPTWRRIEAKLEEFGIPFTTRPIPTGSIYDYYGLDLGSSILVAPHHATVDGYYVIPQIDIKTLAVSDPGFSLDLDVAYLKTAGSDNAIRVVLDALKKAYSVIYTG